MEQEQEMEQMRKWHNYRILGTGTRKVYWKALQEMKQGYMYILDKSGTTQKWKRNFNGSQHLEIF